MKYQEKPAIVISDYGYWIEWRNRKRFVGCSKKELEILKLELNAEESAERMARTRRAFKQGTHEKSYYYRDADGTICIPPDPSLAPAGVALEEIDSLKTADRLSKEMSEQHLQRFQDNGMFTETLQQMFGDPRKALVERMQNPKSDYERDLIRIMLNELDSSRHDLSRIESNSYFHYREYDAGH